MVTLGFASKNNLGINFLNLGWSDDLTEISEMDVKKRVSEKVIDPITESLTIREPHLFMTKCYSKVEATLYDSEYKEESRKYYEEEPIIGTVKFNSCGSIDIICKYQLSLSTNEVTIRESYLQAWIPLEDFLKKLETDEIVEE